MRCNGESIIFQYYGVVDDADDVVADGNGGGDGGGGSGGGGVDSVDDDDGAAEVMLMVMVMVMVMMMMMVLMAMEMMMMMAMEMMMMMMAVPASISSCLGGGSGSGDAITDGADGATPEMEETDKETLAAGAAAGSREGDAETFFWRELSRGVVGVIRNDGIFVNRDILVFVINYVVVTNLGIGVTLIFFEEIKNK